MSFLKSFTRHFTLEFYEIFSHCFQKPITHVCSRHVNDVGKKFSDRRFKFPACLVGIRTFASYFCLLILALVGLKVFFQTMLSLDLLEIFLFVLVLYMQMFVSLEFQRYRKTNIRATNDVNREFS